MKKSIIAAVGLLLCSLQGQSAEISIKGKDGFTLVADYVAVTEPSDKGVLFFHQCNYNRSMYEEMAKMLALKGIPSLSLDFRGFGDSRDGDVDVEKVRALEGQARAQAWQAISNHWEDDVKIAYDFLAEKLNSNAKVAALGASCGGGMAITLSDHREIQAIGLFSSWQNEESIERYKKNMAQKPTLIIAAEKDGETYTVAKTLFEAAQHRSSQLLSYKGKEHGYTLFDQDPNLAQTMSNWLQAQLQE